MNQPCLNTAPSAPCDSPIANLTSEAPDAFTYLSESFVDTGYTPFIPGIGIPWTALGCLGLCTSTISQADADLCAANQVAQCQTGNNPGTQLFTNGPESCTVFCPDGLPFTYTVPAGLFLSTNQSTANAQAQAVACQLANARKICLGTIRDIACKGTTYSSQIVRTGGTAPFSWEIYSGVPPQGIDLDGNGLLSGTVLASGGNYTFTVRVTAGDGSFQQKEYSIQVMSIDSGSTLPLSQVGTPYIYNLLVSGGVSPLSYQIIDGALPAGMTLDEQTGVISGTPSVNGTYSFTVMVQDQAT